MQVLSNWREAHTYPMQAILMLLRTHAQRVDAKAVVSQRLKRAVSIREKLRRCPSMKLDRMQDIAGCRAIVENANQVDELHLRLANSRTQNYLARDDDYIKDPKESGYRGVHMVYKYVGTKEHLAGLSVEVQIRSQLQHAWATSVEIVDTFTGQSLKAGHGETDWYRFFKLASVLIAERERRPLGEEFSCREEALAEFRTLNERLRALERLDAFAVTTHHVKQGISEGFRHFILQLDLATRKLRLVKFKQNQLDRATQRYRELEQEQGERLNSNVVLVSADSVKNVKTAFPNYFADSKRFVNTMGEALRG